MQLNRNKSVLIAGGSGLVGQHLSLLLAASGYKIKILTRGPSRPSENVFHWDPMKNEFDDEALNGVEAVVNLSGAGIADSLWTPWRKREIMNSRVISTRLLVNKVKSAGSEVKVMIHSSATGIYGDTGMSIVHEDSPAVTNFLGNVCTRWEAESEKASPEVRNVILRIGNVLAKEGGFFPTTLIPFKFRIAPVYGTGEQYLSWIHIEDLCCLISACISQNQFRGTYNAVSPGPLSMRNLVTLFKQVLGGLYLTVRVPAPILKLFLGGMAILLTEGSRASSEKIIKAGFKFKFDRADKAIKNLIN